MRKFAIYTHPTLERQAIKIGFAWPGFFFGCIWLLVCGLWVHTIAIICFSAFFSNIFETAYPNSPVLMPFLITFVIALIIGLTGNQWRRDNLVKRGFQELIIIEAESKDKALWVSEQPQSQPYQSKGQVKIESLIIPIVVLLVIAVLAIGIGFPGFKR